MSKVVHKISTLKAISVCFSKLAGKSKYQGKWRTNDQWSALLWAYYQDVLSPSIKQNDMDGKTLDVALHKNKLIKANLKNYVKGTNGTGIMCHSFIPRTTLNGSVTLQELLLIATSLSLPMMLSQSSFRDRAGGKCFHQLRRMKATGTRGYVRH
jgi:hypothetical protein